ncbi:MAG: amidohydrolase family protein [Desulfobacterales bacterium]|nr:amidohydrolase family protein [Desulfobacterales bacterium]
MIVDFHTHIFPENIRQNRADFFHKEESFELLYSSPNSKMSGSEELIASMDENEVDISVVFGFPWQNKELIKMHNDYVIDSVKKYKGRLIGFCCVNPLDESALQEVIRCIEIGLLGVGEIAFYKSGIDDEALNKISPIMDICLKKDIPILIHTNEPIGHTYPGKAPIFLKEIHNLTKKFAENKIILAHWGGGLFFYNLLKKELKSDLKNVYFDTAASPFLYDSLIYYVAAKIIGKDKILFGSDFPLISPKRYFKELKNAQLNNEEIKNICGINAKNLLKL